MKACIAKMIEHFEATRPVIEAAKGEKLFIDSEGLEGVYLVKAGKIEMRVTCPVGANILRTAGRGEILGVAPLFCGQPHRLAGAVAARAKVIFVESKEFLAYLDQHPDARIYVLQMLSADVSSCYDLIRGAIEPPAKSAAAVATVW
jgi:CRP-like cAMP-binding protein